MPPPGQPGPSQTEQKSRARLEEQHCWGPASTPHAVSYPARRAVVGKIGPTGLVPVSDLWFPHVQEDVKAGTGAPGILQISGHVFLSRHYLCKMCLSQSPAQAAISSPQLLHGVPEAWSTPRQ